MTEEKITLKEALENTVVSTVDNLKPMLDDYVQTAIDSALVTTFKEQKKEAEEKKEQAKEKREKAKKKNPRKYDFSIRGLTYAQHRRITSKAIIKQFESTNKYLLHIIEEYPKLLKELEALKKKVNEQ